MLLPNFSTSSQYHTANCSRKFWQTLNVPWDIEVEQSQFWRQRWQLKDLEKLGERWGRGNNCIWCEKTSEEVRYGDSWKCKGRLKGQRKWAQSFSAVQNALELNCAVSSLPSVPWISLTGRLMRGDSAEKSSEWPLKEWRRNFPRNTKRFFLKC